MSKLIKGSRRQREPHCQSSRFLWLKKAFCLFFPIICGGAVGYLISAYGREFVRPPLTPPDTVFYIVWTALYLIMGYSSLLVFCLSGCRLSCLGGYFSQLALNLCWPVSFFIFGHYRLSVLILAALILSLIATISDFLKISKKAARLNYPYLIWCFFALYLNIASALIN